MQDKAGLYIFLVFGFVMTYIALQFWFITKDCYVNNYIALSIAIISWLCVFFWLPESPRFLYSRKQFAKAKQVILMMARVNQKEAQFDPDFIFEVEKPIEPQQ